MKQANCQRRGRAGRTGASRIAICWLASGMSWPSGGVATRHFAPAGGIAHHYETCIAIGRGHQELMVIAADIGA